MIRLNNDYNRGAHPAVLELLQKTNDESYPGYGEDAWCEKAAQEIRKYLGGQDAEIHFMTGGTQVNFTVIAAALRPYQGVISADTGHIQNHETGSVENTGHKIHALPGTDGKLTAQAIEKEAKKYRDTVPNDHLTEPRMVFLSFPSEYGTIYSKEELTAIHRVCREYGMYLYVDGARLGYGLGSEACDVTLADLAALADVFYIGGTKCGALFGEAVVICNPALRDHFRSYMKQNGGMLAKGWLLGLQFYALFKDGLYFEITKEADRKAMALKEAFTKKQIPFYIESWTNQQFVILDRDQMDRLAEVCVFQPDAELEDGRTCVRFCTGWSTGQEEVEQVVQAVGAL